MTTTPDKKQSISDQAEHLVELCSDLQKAVLVKHTVAILEVVKEQTLELKQVKQQRDELQAKWDYYQEFCKAHGATSITDLVVQRDELVNVLEQIGGANSAQVAPVYSELARAAIDAAMKGEK